MVSAKKLARRHVFSKHVLLCEDDGLILCKRVFFELEDLFAVELSDFVFLGSST